MRHRATVCRALLRDLSPPRFSRCRTVFPEDAGIGFTPAKEANPASFLTRPSCDHTVRHVAAVTGPNPFSSSSGAASLAVNAVYLAWVC